MIELFDLTKTLFENPQAWEEISKADKRKHSFIVNRMFSIGHPLQAQLLQHIKISPSVMIDIWQRLMTIKFGYNKTPGWMFTKGTVKNKLEKEVKTNLSEEIIKEYCKKFRVDYKSVKDALKFFPTKMTTEIKEYEKTIKEK
jgi:hypothetical protein